MRWWAADREAGLMKRQAGTWRQLGPPGQCLCRCGRRILCAGEKAVSCYDERTGDALYQTPCPGGGCAMTSCGDLFYLVSQDADSITAWTAADGCLAYSAPAGVYPRDAACSPDGRMLAVAAGAAGEILLFDPQLHVLQSLPVPGIACGVCFLQKGLGALCAIGEEHITSLLLRISPRGVTETLFSCPDAPCSLCPLRGGCAVGCWGRVYFLRENGRLIRTAAFPGPVRLRPLGPSALICDPLQGGVYLPNGKALFTGPSPEDFLFGSS